MADATAHTPIGEYAVIGDCRAAALVSRAGSIDWLCWPRFDSPALFAALLDPERGGSFRVAPADVAPGSRASRVTRRYLPETNVLETRFRTDTGEATLTDAMTVASDDDARARLLPEHEIVRIVACERGEVTIDVAFEPRPRFATRPPRLRAMGKLGVRADLGPHASVYLRSDAPLDVDLHGAYARVRLRAGHRARFALVFASDAPAVLSPLGEHAEEAVARTAAFWRGWAARARYVGPYRDAVVRSALTLKLLAYAPSNAIVAAVTTSLPERAAGDLNWDYRYCWLRDASLTARALLGLGYRAEAELWGRWLVHTTRVPGRALRVLYDVYGARPGAEATLDHLAGHGGARPVRVRNAAADQLQIDVHGEVIDAVARLAEPGTPLDRDTQRMLLASGKWICRHWTEPDNGIWESRTTRRRHTLGAAMAWVALDRLVDLYARGCLRGVPLERFEEVRARIRRTIETRGWSASLGSYTAALDGDDVDAALLLLGRYGFEDPASPRMRGTYARIRERLGVGPFLLRYRRDDAEAAFGVCTFWAVEHLARGGGTLDEARAAFEAALAAANDVGLYAEEIDPRTGAAVGNFPQAFTHVGLINAALTLEQRDGRARGTTRRAIRREPREEPREAPPPRPWPMPPAPPPFAGGGPMAERPARLRGGWGQ